MKRFAVDDEVAGWEKALASRRGPARLPVLLPLAWHLRQRDSRRAQALAAEALTLLDEAMPDKALLNEGGLNEGGLNEGGINEAGINKAGLAAAQRDGARARMQLVQAEVRWLNGELEAARQQAGDVLARFGELDDPAGCADAHWLLAWIAIDGGDHDASDAAFGAAADWARRADDALRTWLAEAALARWAVLRDRNTAMARWGGHFTAQTAALDPSLATWIDDFLGLAASQVADFGAAAGHFIGCHAAALATGQLRAAITAATNIGEDFTILNDHHSALAWMQSALELARPTGWPRSVGACLMHTADTLRRLGQLDAAHDMLTEAKIILKPLANARSYAIALQYLGDLSLDQGNYQNALDAFRQLEARADALHQADFRSVAQRGQAHALSQLGRPNEALAAAGAAIDMAAEQGHALNHIAALRAMAMIHAGHDLPPPPGMVALNPALHYLYQALAVAATIDGYTVPGDLYDAMARQYAGAGAFAQAYDFARRSGAAREKTHGQEATNRAVAMQVHHRTEQARRASRHDRELAESEARRAEVLQRTSVTLERLSAIGQEITTHLDAAAVFHALERHIHGLLPAAAFAIYLSDSAGLTLRRAFSAAMGKLAPADTVANPSANPDANPGAHLDARPDAGLDADAARCLRERCEIYIDDQHGAGQDGAEPGAPAGMSALCVPLTVGERAMGVMTVQAAHARAYGENERMIFRTLCAYGAIALDNADAYRRLQDAQAQLVSQEKLAALGALMAGVAHELNTPIGNSLLIASTMQEKTAEIASLMNGPGMRRSELDAYIDDAGKACTLVMRGLTSAADLVSSFKQVALDRTTEQRRHFELRQVCHEIIATMLNRVRAANHVITLRMDEAIAMDSYPGPFGQVIGNFVNNALLHAFAPDQRGHMVLAASTPQAGWVRVTFSDDGGGIPEAHLGRIFDPFFTTKLGQGGSGLGLSISYNIVTALLGGRIAAHSGAGAGSSFVLDLPLAAPRHDPARAADA